MQFENIEYILSCIPDYNIKEEVLYIYKNTEHNIEHSTHGNNVVYGKYVISDNTSEHVLDNEDYIKTVSLNKKEYDEYFEKYRLSVNAFWKYMNDELENVVPDYIAKSICDESYDMIDENIVDTVYNDNPRMLFKIIYCNCVMLLRDLSNEVK